MGILIRLLIGALGLVAFGTPVYAQDMSGWSDKTICRLVAEHGNSEYIEEAKGRSLECDIGTPNKTTSNKTSKAFSTLTYKAQSILQHLQFSEDKATGRWDESTSKALKAFLKSQNNEFHGTLESEHISLLEDAHISKTGDFPLFGSKGVDLALSMPKSIPNTENGWDELLKTELHRIDISKAELAPLNIGNYRKAAQSGTIFDPYSLGMVKGSNCFDINYKFKTYRNDPPAGAWCNFILRKYLPTVGPEPIQDILNYWASQPVKNYAPNYGHNPDKNNVYTLQQHYAQIATTYALFYEEFDNHGRIDKWLVEWGTTYERTRSEGAQMCPFADPFIMKKAKIQGTKYSDPSGCGSKKWRGSVARIALGLRLRNQELYLSGVRQLESLLGMFDQNGIYVHYATRGWDSLGYTIDVPEYLSNIALLFESVNYDFYSLKTNSGFTVGELIAKTNAWLAQPILAENYYKGTRNERPGEQPKYFGNVSDYGGYDQWRRERQSEDQDILLRSFHYLYKKEPEQLAPNPTQIVTDLKNSIYGLDLPNMYFYGFSSAIPLVLSVLDQDDTNWTNTFPHRYPFNGLSVTKSDDLKNDVLKEWKQLKDQNDFNIESFIHPSILTKYDPPKSKTISFDVYYIESKKTRGDYGMSGYIDRKEPLVVNIDDINVRLDRGTHIAEATNGSKIGEINGQFLSLSFTGIMCDSCRPEKIDIIVSLPLMTGISKNKTKEGRRLVLLPLP